MNIIFEHGKMNSQKSIGDNVMKTDKELADLYFRINAQIGLTKHVGGSFATDELMLLCHVTPYSYILEVGCGVGLATSYIAKNFDCKIMAVDLRSDMLKIAKTTVKNRGVEKLVEFKIGNAEKLPFKDNTFDAVITESVTAFTEKSKSIAEYVRVCKKGGYVGLGELTWMNKTPDDIKDFFHLMAGGVRPLYKEDWTDLVKGAGLTNVIVKTENVKMFKQFKGEVKIYGWNYIFHALGKTIKLYLKDPEFKSDIKDLTKLTKKGRPKGLTKHTYLGLYVGKK
ncbi:MAG: class I SAM-dependent methyltransferase [Candidatus Cloacimonetes bacterium]|nr:class I SAM-dependent methyltransferase [Candidatus Cloacimonadota bacterium]